MKLIKENRYLGNVRLNVVKKALALGLVATTLFSLSSCKSNYEYVTDPDTGIIKLEGSLSYEYLEDCKILQYKDVYDNEKIMLVEFYSSIGRYYNYYYVIDVETGQTLSDVQNFEDESIKKMINEDYGEFISIENFSKYLNAYGSRKERYTAEDIDQMIILIKESKIKEETVTKVLKTWVGTSPKLLATSIPSVVSGLYS